MAGLEGKLIAAGLKHGVPVAGDWIESELRDRGVLPEKNAETLFVDTLRDELKSAALQSEGDTADELYSVALHWELVEEELADLDTALDTEESAVTEIVETLKDAPETEFSVTDDETLRRVVTRAYRETITTYAERLAGTGFAEEFQLQAEIRLSEQVQSVVDRLDEVVGRTTPTARYDSYDPDDPDAVETLVDRVVETERERFVDRLEFDGAPDAERLLVVGPAGSGKSRVLGELIERTADEGRVSRIVTPTDGLVSQRDEWAFEYETFDGDVLLVWDDIHRIAESGETDAFESVVSALSGVLNEQGHDLHVLCAARSGNVDDLPRVASVESIQRKQKGLWEPFEVLELDDLGNDPLGEIADVRAVVHGVAFGTEAGRAALVEKASGPSAPEYVDAVLRTQTDGTDAERVLTEGDVAETPDSIADIWYEQFYDVLDDDDELAVLEACKLLYDVNIRYLVPLVRAVWTEVFGKNGGKRAFADAVESLVARDWVVLVGDGPLADEALLWMHDTQCEAVDRGIAAYVSDVSSVLMSSPGGVSDNLPDDVLIELNRRFADGVRKITHGWPDVRDGHYRWALTESSDSGDILDSANTVAHSNYGNLLKETNRLEKAEKHYRQALLETSETGDPLDSTLAQAHLNYGVLLEETNRPEKAEKHYRQALLETSETDDPLDSTDAEAHSNYGILLEETNRPEKAEKHYRQALLETSETDDPLDSTLAQAHLNYGVLLKETNRPEKAEKHYRQALLETSETDDPLDFTLAQAHYNYGNLLEETNRPEKAEKHYRQALLETSETGDPLDSTLAQAHLNYGVLLKETNRPEKAEKHYRQALLETSETDDPLDSTYAEAHSNYGILLEETNRPEKAEKHYRQALLETSETDDLLDSTLAQAHLNYGVLLKETNRPEKAEKHYRQALLETSETDDPLDSTLAQAHLNYGILLEETNRPEKAEKHYRQALLETSETADPLDSTDAQAHYNYGLLLQETNRPEKAEKHYRQALLETSETADPLDSTDAQAHYNYGLLLQETNRPEKAEEHYRQALLETSETADPLDSTYAKAHYNYGNLLKETNRPEKAEEHYRQALLETSETNDPLDSTDAQAHSNYGLLLQETNRPEKAEKHYRQALLETSETDDPLDSTYAKAHYNYGLLLQETNRPEKAEKHYRQALLETSETADPLDSTYAKAHYNYGLLLQETNRPEKAEEHYRQALLETSETADPLDSTDAKAHYNYGNLLKETNRPEKAEEHYRQALLETSETDDPLDSTDAKAHYNYGALLFKEERLSEARSHIERSTELWQEQDRPQNVLHDSRLLVMICDRLNDHDAAIRHCERAIELGHEIGDIETEREFRERYARLDGRDVSDKVSEQYGFALQAVVRREFETAAELFGAAWRHREDFSDHQPPYWMTLAGGLWLRALVPVSELTVDDETDAEIRSTVESATDRLSITTRELYRWLYNEGALSTPAHLRTSVTDDDTITQLELDAYETLVQLLEQ